VSRSHHSSAQSTAQSRRYEHPVLYLGSCTCGNLLVPHSEGSSSGRDSLAYAPRGLLECLLLYPQNGQDDGQDEETEDRTYTVRYRVGAFLAVLLEVVDVAHWTCPPE